MLNKKKRRDKTHEYISAQSLVKQYREKQKSYSHYKRKVAKANKDWASADAIRAKINELGYVVKDTKDGSFAEKAE